MKIPLEILACRLLSAIPANNVFFVINFSSQTFTCIVFYNFMYNNVKIYWDLIENRPSGFYMLSPLTISSLLLINLL